MRLIVLMIAAMPLFGQLQSVQIRVSGLDCESCAGAVQPRLQRMRGVESARYDREKSTVIIQLAPENRTSLAMIRDALKGLGHTPGEATVTAKGDLHEKGGEWFLSFPAQQNALTVQSTPKLNPGAAVLEGSVAAGTDKIIVTAVWTK